VERRRRAHPRVELASSVVGYPIRVASRVGVTGILRGIDPLLAGDLRELAIHVPGVDLQPCPRAQLDPDVVAMARPPVAQDAEAQVTEHLRSTPPRDGA